MQGKSSSSGNMMPVTSYGLLDLQGSNYVHNQHNPHSCQSSMALCQVHDGFPQRVRNMHELDQPVLFCDYNKAERGKNSMSDDDEMNCGEEGVDAHSEASRGKKGSPWHRIKWTDKMVRLLITAVSYIGEDISSESNGSGRRKSLLIQKKGKWKTVSKVMAERRYFVSPQQCEDKFNDLNKRYKRLNDILGRGTSCKVVENPKLLDVMDLPEKAKEDVKKILSSKHLFYEEMCSYHNRNRLFLPPDPDLQHSLQLALKSKDDYEPHEMRLHNADDFDEEDQEAEGDDQDDETEGAFAVHKDSGGTFGFPGISAKTMREGEEFGNVGFGSSLNFLDCNRRSYAHLQSGCMDVNHIPPEAGKMDWLREKSMIARSIQLEEKKLQIQAEMLELEKQRFKWQRFSRKEDRELDQMRLENECMKLENERMALELKHKELGAGSN